MKSSISAHQHDIKPFFNLFLGVTPIPSSPSKYCKVGQSDKVSPWDRHSAIEVNSLMEMQQILFHPKAECTKKLSEYLCYPAETCAARKTARSIKSKIQDLCKSALKAW